VSMNIESYRFGEICIDGKSYSKDLKIIKGRIVANWWRKEGHTVQLCDIEDVIAEKPHTLIIGSGASGRLKMAPGLSGELGQYGIRLETLPTELAIQRFRELAGQLGLDQVAAAFHLTC